MAHPDGLKVLQKYDALTKSQMPPAEQLLSDAIASALCNVIHEKEPEITKCLRTVLNAKWNAGFTITGEKEESVVEVGNLQGSATGGDPDAVARKPHGPSSTNKAFMIAEGFVDDNSGEKKIGQAYESYYASLISNPHESMILCTIHFDRNKKSTNRMKAVIECFIFVSNSDEPRRKIGFLWREVYEVEPATTLESDLDFLKRCCPGIVRCLMCTEYLFAIASLPKPNWSVISDNAAVEEQTSVFKVFDNRFHPTYRKPSNWLPTAPKPWLAVFNAVEHLRYEEGPTPDVIGSPNTKRKNMASGRDGIVPYYRGAVVVVKYDYLEGTHIAWRASHFAAISETIKAMHSQNIVHADVRGFNMLHPIEDNSTCIQSSILLDFDLSGVHGTDIYPPGFVDNLKDVAFIRAGKPNSTMLKYDDWYELASCMALYDAVGDDSVTEAWLELVSMFAELDGEPFPGGDGDIFAAKLDAFISKHGDCRLKLQPVAKLNWRRVFKGTGSPDKKKKVPRGKHTSER